MKFKEAKAEFVNAWGALGIAWGINKTMAQIFALLFISPEPLSVEQIMEDLGISRGNSSMNLRALMDWNLIYKTTKKGDRREYFYTDEDFWSLSKKVAAERAKREFEPMIRMLNKVDKLEDNDDPEVARFRAAVNDISELVQAFDIILKLYIQSDKTMVLSSLAAFQPPPDNS